MAANYVEINSNILIRSKDHAISEPKECYTSKAGKGRMGSSLCFFFLMKALGRKFE